MTYISPHKVFSHLDRLTAWRDGDTPAPVTVEWDLTNRCSLGCEGCHFAHTHTKGPWAGKALLPMAYENTGDVADLKLVTRGLAEAAEAGVKAVVWSGGGEPTLHPQWQEIVIYAAASGLRQGMYTLGGHLNSQSAKVLARYADWVVVSLDCADAETYAAEKRVSENRFAEACQGIELLASEHEAVVGVSFLLHSKNFTRAQEMMNLARSLGATYSTFRPLIETHVAYPSQTNRSLTEWIDFNRDWPDIVTQLESEPDVEISGSRFSNYAHWKGHGYKMCYGVRMATMVTPDGRMWICPQRRGINGSCLGDLRTDSFEAIWRRHPGHYAVDSGCRAMCRFHQMNQVLDDVFTPREHTAFV